MRMRSAVWATVLVAGVLAVLAVSCDYDDLDGIPPGFADGVDNDTHAAPGAGLALGSGGELEVDFTGTGVADTVARSDHEHDTAYVLKAGDTMTGALALPGDGLAVGTDQLVVSGGKVGVGTATPSALFEVADYPGIGALDQESTVSTGAGSGDWWQSFTVGVSGRLTAVAVDVQSADDTVLNVYAGEGTGGSLVHSSAISLTAGWNVLLVTSPVDATVGQIYTIAINSSAGWRLSTVDPYPGGISAVAGIDVCFRTYTAPAQTALFSVTRTGIHLAAQGATPPNPSEGDIYYDATLHKVRCFDGTVWQDMW